MNRADQTVRVLPGIGSLQPIEQLASRGCRIGVKPRTQFVRHSNERVRAPPIALRFLLRLRRRANVTKPAGQLKAEAQLIAPTLFGVFIELAALAFRLFGFPPGRR